MSLRIRRGLNSERTTKVLDTGEIAWTTDTKKLYVGDGSTTGGVNILANSVDSTSGLAWDNTTQKIKYTGALGSALSNVVEDISPELGGDLNLNNKTINGTGTINFTGNITASALSLTTGLGANLPLNSRNITGTGNIGITGNLSASGTLIASTGLGANLSLNTYNINGVGNVGITGNLSASGTLTASTGLGANLPLNGYTINGTGNVNITGDVTATNLNTNRIYGGSNNVEIVANASSHSVVGITSGNSSGIGTFNFTIKAQKGSIASPTDTAAGDRLGGIFITGYANGSFKPSSVISSSWEPGATLTDVFPESTLSLGVGGGGTTLISATLDSNGVFSSLYFRAADGTASLPSIGFTTDGSQDSGFFHPGDGIVCTAINGVELVRVDSGGMRVEGFMKVKNVAGTLPNPPEAGMIVLDGTTFKGYNGSAWVDLN